MTSAKRLPDDASASDDCLQASSEFHFLDLVEITPETSRHVHERLRDTQVFEKPVCHQERRKRGHLAERDLAYKMLPRLQQCHIEFSISPAALRFIKDICGGNVRGEPGLPAAA